MAPAFRAPCLQVSFGDPHAATAVGAGVAARGTHCTRVIVKTSDFVRPEFFRGDGEDPRSCSEVEAGPSRLAGRGFRTKKRRQAEVVACSPVPKAMAPPMRKMMRGRGNADGHFPWVSTTPMTRPMRWGSRGALARAATRSASNFSTLPPKTSASRRSSADFSA